MNKILSIRVQDFKNKTHFTFMQFVKMAIALYSIIGRDFQKAVSAFLAAFEREDEVLLKHNRSFLTPEVQQADQLRDDQFRRLRNYLKSLIPVARNEEKRKAAEFLFQIIEDYGGSGIPAMQFDEESGALTNLYDDLQRKYSERVALLDIAPFVNEAKEANDNFIRLLNERTHEYSGFVRGEMQAARNETDKAYRRLVDSIDIAIDFDEEGLYQPFTNYLNAEIQRLRIVIGQGVGNPGTGDSGVGGGNDTGGSGSTGGNGSGSGSTGGSGSAGGNENTGGGSGGNTGGGSTGGGNTPPSGGNTGEDQPF